jgi:hypothetical protein
METIAYPDELYVGMYIWVIERKNRTGNEDAVYRNCITAIGIFDVGYSAVGFRYVHGSYMPEYFARFDEIGKTVFFSEKEAEAALRKEKRHAKNA